MRFRTACWLGLLLTATANAADGLALYKDACHRCHGTEGKGTKRAPKPLIGSLSVAQLASQIQKTMPEDSPNSLSQADALKIAAYLHENFYSPAAQERNRPPRVELARLTVPQYRNSVADLVASLRGGGNVSWWDVKRGLKGEYFKKRNYNERQLERNDAEVKFDFADKSPVEGKIEATEYSIRWSGSVLAPETGDYTFIVRSNQAIKLYINTDWRKPSIDATVKSGNDTEYKVTVYLLGGRTYPLQLDFSKALQGVKDKNPKPTPAFVHLLWQPPFGTIEHIPARVLSPQNTPVQYIVETKFPADDRSYGWERGTTISKAWDAATTEAALDAAGYMATKVNDLAGTNDKDAPEKRKEKIVTMLKKFIARAFRQPLNAETEALYLTRALTTTPDLESAVKRVVLLVLKSPRFLYREVGGESQYDVAARLSFALWDSLPDQELLNAAGAGQLKTLDQVRKHAQRMTNDTRFRYQAREFLHHWLRTDHGRDATKDPKRFPGFDAAVIADLRSSLEMTLDDVLTTEKADFKQLLLSDELYLNGRLAKYYGANLPADAGFSKMAFEKDKRAGVLTHPFILATFAYSAETSPIHRGVFLAKGVLGTGLKPPQEAFSPLAADLHPTLTTRERVLLQTKGANCQTCHTVINNLGFTLEQFDATGKFRTLDNKKPIDATGSYVTRAGQTKMFKGPRELATFLAESEDVHTSFTEQMFHHLIQQSVRAYGPNRSAELRDVFRSSGYNIRTLAIEIAATAALTNRPKLTS